MATTSALSGIKVIDVDTHLTEPHDLWTSRAPAEWVDRVPAVKEVDGQPMWTIDGTVLGRAGASGVVRDDGSKSRGAEFMQWLIDDVHPAAYDVEARLGLMDELGIWAQIVYPNAAGFGGQKFGTGPLDPALQLLCVTIYNDAMAEIQADSGGRLYPMALLPWWDLDASVKEIERAKALGLRGVNTNADPQNQGLPDLGDRRWDPLWETCADLGLPVNFHIGASETQHSWFGNSPWPSMGPDEKLAIGSSMIYLANARILANLIFSGVLERFPTLDIVSVESGIGWIPFTLDALDYQMAETAPGATEYLSMKPSDYFRRQVYACFWFEQRDLPHIVETVGTDRVMFETDFPHPTCLYPDSVRSAAPGLDELTPEVRYQVLCGNAARVYSLPVDAS
jgi:predicted TIM-barrel fold metal-dependent hydrolase